MVEDKVNFVCSTVSMLVMSSTTSGGASACAWRQILARLSSLVDITDCL